MNMKIRNKVKMDLFNKKEEKINRDSYINS